MTVWNMPIRVKVLPPGVDHAIDGTVIDGWVDYNIVINNGTSQFITPPYPSSSEISLLFDIDVIPDIELGAWFVIESQMESLFNWKPIYSGYVTNIASEYRYMGNSGYILEWRYTLTSAISMLQNMTWYNDTLFTGSTYDCFEKILASYGRTPWSAMGDVSWENLRPLTWAEFDDSVLNTLPVISHDFDTRSQTLTAGSRNVWDDFVTLTYGLYGYCSELVTGELYFNWDLIKVADNLVLDSSQINTDIASNLSVSDIRNVVSVTRYDGTTSTHYDHDSVSIYNQRTGSINTYIDNALEAADVAENVLNALAYPLLCTRQISINLLNPIFTASDRDLFTEPILRNIGVEAPIAMGGTMSYRTIGYSLNISKNEYTITMNLAPHSEIYGSIQWYRIPYSYTWTSYGTAFPTQEWKDL
jgi:hypothetical protein